MAGAALAFSSTAPGMTSAYFGLQDKTSWMATATARVGYAWGRTLFYAKGGAAFENSNVSATCFNPQGPALPVPNPCVNQAGAVFANGTGFGTSSTRVGWTIGYGAEFDLGKNWSAKAEYDYLSFGSRTALASDGTTTITDKSDISQVKVGLNYRFRARDGGRQVLMPERLVRPRPNLRD